MADRQPGAHMVISSDVSFRMNSNRDAARLFRGQVTRSVNCVAAAQACFGMQVAL
jgi:hypothetical protein